MLSVHHSCNFKNVIKQYTNKDLVLYMELYIGTIQHWKLRAGDKESLGNIRGQGHSRRKNSGLCAFSGLQAQGTPETKETVDAKREGRSCGKVKKNRSFLPLCYVSTTN